MRLDKTSLALALALTLSNAAKDLVVDDVSYVAVATQIASHPLDPFGFPLSRDSLEARPPPAHEQLLTPLLPYFLAPAIRLFPDQPVAWKLWLFPFALALVVAARQLAAQVAPGLDVALTALFVLSPAVLPAFNLMLDVPALALAWLSIAVFLAAGDRRSLWLALGAGVLAGLAAQTKYPGGTALAVIAVCAAQRRFWRGGALAVLGGVTVFAAWELFVFRTYGHTMLFTAAGQRPALIARSPATLVLGLLSLLGALAPGVAPLGLAQWRRAGSVAAILQAGAFGLMLAAPSFLASLGAALLPDSLDAQSIAFLPAAIAVLAALVLGVRRAARGEELDRLLLAWGVIEVVAALAMTPFLASRRLLGLAGVATLLVGRAVTGEASRRRVAWCAAWSAALGCFVFAIDWTAARETRMAVARAGTRLEQLGFDAARQRVWFNAHWGFEYYAKRAGWHAIETGSRLLPGDWLVEPEHMPRQSVLLLPSDWLVKPKGISGRLLQRRLLKRLASLDDPPRLPLTTIPYYYVGAIPVGALRSAQVPLEIGQLRREAVAHGPGLP